MTEKEFGFVSGIVTVGKLASLVWAVVHFGWLVLVPIIVGAISLESKPGLIRG